MNDCFYDQGGGLPQLQAQNPMMLNVPNNMGAGSTSSANSDGSAQVVSF